MTDAKNELDEAEAASVLKAAISYAPLGCREEALQVLEEVLQSVNEVKELRSFGYWAAYALRGIAGEKRMVAPSCEEEARAFLAQNSRTVGRLLWLRKNVTEQEMNKLLSLTYDATPQVSHQPGRY